MSTTLTFKTRQRYAYGWTDPRMPHFREPRVLEPRQSYKTGLEHVETETLRNLWLVHFGEYAVEMYAMHAVGDDPIINIAKELASRGLVSEEQQNHVETDEYKEYYVLNRMWGRDDGDN